MKKQLTLLLTALCILCNAAIAQLPSYLPADGLVAWYPFNGNANDESGNGNDGVVNGATLTEDRFGNAQSAFGFDGNDKIEIANWNEINGNIDFTVSCWVKQGDGLGWVMAFGQPTNGQGFVMGNYHWGQSNIGGQIWKYDYISSTSAPIEIGIWHQIVFVYTFNTLSIYKDGILSTSSLVDYTTTDIQSGILSIGKQIVFNEYFNGSIDDIAIYNRALTPQEIQNLYTGTNETVDTGNGAAPLPQGIPYQAAARDAQGQAIVSAPVNVRFSLHEGAVDGAVSYSETHALTTNSIGLFNTVFGNGTPEQSAFDSINWAATTKFLQVEIDLGDGYVDMGTTQLLSVPYAFRSDEAARIKNAGLPIFADNAAALAGGLVAGEMYRTAAGDLKVVY
jgi:hypothetical protein